jgi:hypothetical protein
MSGPDLRTAPSGRSGVGGWLTGLAVLGGLLVVRSVVRWLRGGRHDGQRSSRPPRVDQHAVQAGHETRETPVLPVVVGGLAVVIGIGATFVVATWFQAAWVARPLTMSPPPGLETPVPPPPPPEPRLDEVSGAQLRALRAAEDRILNDTAWVDRQSGVARIPIDQAIDLLAEHPLPARPAADAGQDASAPSPPSGASSGRVPTGRVP